MGALYPARARSSFIASFQPSLEMEEDGWAARTEISGNRGAFGAYKETAKRKEIKRLNVKKLVLGAATDAETNIEAEDAPRGHFSAVCRAAAHGKVETRATAQQPWTLR